MKVFYCFAFSQPLISLAHLAQLGKKKLGLIIIFFLKFNFSDNRWHAASISAHFTVLPIYYFNSHGRFVEKKQRKVYQSFEDSFDLFLYQSLIPNLTKWLLTLVALASQGLVSVKRDKLSKHRVSVL